MSCTIVVRSACAADGEARADLVRASILQYTRDAFFMFLFQELTLQLCVLGGAVLFIFCGASVAACCTVVPALAALLVAAGVYVTHAVLADKHVVDMRKEMIGLVAELRAPLLVDPRSARPRVMLADGAEFASLRPFHTQIVGTVSVSELRSATSGGWLHSLAVHEQWRRRGVGRALVGAARARSEPQRAAWRRWEVRGSYHRPLLGSALTLPVLVFGVESSTLA
ncbi:uncharacterized protein LOC119189630 [Manduca sexta]|uniref:uncharacterized protein LOC119189630 n=1 Tax=Manduca sexta TaxID=7130 RepID=UPI001890A9E7|nr:uncharacterized protein LOC119189630 [Manduca sexta]